MLEKLALWYLEKKGNSVILNCEFAEPFVIKTKDKIKHRKNHYINGSKFLFESGGEFTITKTGEDL